MLAALERQLAWARATAPANAIGVYAAGRQLGLVRRYHSKRAKQERERKRHRARVLKRIAERDGVLAAAVRAGKLPLYGAARRLGFSRHGTPPEPEPEPEPEPVRKAPARVYRDKLRAHRRRRR